MDKMKVSWLATSGDLLISEESAEPSALLTKLCQQVASIAHLGEARFKAK
jgi:hypothetical protein